MLLAAQHGTVVWHAGSSEAVTIDRSSRRAEGLARSLSKAGGINFEVKERGRDPLTSGASASGAARACSKSCCTPDEASGVSAPSIRLRCRIIRRNLTLTDTAPNHPLPPHHRTHYLSTPHNGRVRPSRSCATPSLRQLTPGWPAGPPTQSYLVLTASSWVFRENKVPQYQAYFQKHDGLRTWEKVRLT